jgi:hypothetical protein
VVPPIVVPVGVWLCEYGWDGDGEAVDAPEGLGDPDTLTVSVWLGDSDSDSESEGLAIMTATGASLLVVLSSPSCPKSLKPQHHAAPPGEATAQVWSPPLVRAK